MTATLTPRNGRKTGSTKKTATAKPSSRRSPRRRGALDDSARTLDLRFFQAVLAVRSPLQFWFRGLLLFGAILAYRVLGNEALQRSPHFTTALLCVSALAGMTMVCYLVESFRVRAESRRHHSAGVRRDPPAD